MKKNGFIATSILYSFFLVFITLFVALILNYLHNQVLISAIDEASWEMLLGINNTKISDLEVGDHIKFSTTPGQTLINEDATWVVAYIETSGTNKKYYFLSDLFAQNSEVFYKLTTDRIILYHAITLDVFNDLNSQGFYTKAFKFPNINISIPTSSMLQKIRNQNFGNNIMNSIYGVDGDYVIKIDNTVAGYTTGAYYQYRTFAFNEANQSILNKYCNGTFNGTTAQYNANNSLGYMNVVNETAKNTYYVNYCSYANPLAYSLPASDKIVPLNETRPQGDIITATYSSIYAIRLMADVTVNTGATNTYIAGGKGTSLDPYLLTNGGKQ